MIEMQVCGEPNRHQVSFPVAMHAMHVTGPESDGSLSVTSACRQLVQSVFQYGPHVSYVDDPVAVAIHAMHVTGSMKVRSKDHHARDFALHKRRRCVFLLRVGVSRTWWTRPSGVFALKA
jgi:hypothetical protein